MTIAFKTPRLTQNDRRLLFALAALVPLVQVVALVVSSAEYSYFIDEFYYLACSKHLALGYVDHPPLSPWLLAFTRLFLGESLLGIRLLPFLAAGATVWTVGLLVDELGGGHFATILATLAFGLSPVFVAVTSFFSMNAFEPLIWTLATLAIVRIARTGNSRLWVLAGVLIGLGFENKHTIVPYVIALAAGMVVARVIEWPRAKGGRSAASLEARRGHSQAEAWTWNTLQVGNAWSLRDGWLWAGAGLAVALAAPNVLWQAMNGWPSLEFYRNAQTLKNIPSPPLQSLVTQVLAMNPITFPIWSAGLAFLLFARDARALRFAGLTFLALLAMHVASATSRPDRMLAAYPILMAAGGVVLERSFSAPSRARRPHRQWP